MESIKKINGNIIWIVYINMSRRFSSLLGHTHCTSHTRWLLDLISTVKLQLAAIVNRIVLFIMAPS